MMEQNDIDYMYDVALSFAGEDREYVEDVATFLRGYGVKVFYDKFEQADLWGKNLYDHLNDIYNKKARYTIMFISKAYKEKAWTNHERQSAQTRAFKESKEYILPVKFDDTEILGLNETISYLDGNKYSSKDVSKVFLEKSGFSIKKRWWGNWEAGKYRNWFEQNLYITRVDSQGFDFELICIHGVHIGEIDGYAKFISSDEAICEINDGYDEKPCKLFFYRINESMQVTEDNCNAYHGMRAYFFNDSYELNKDIFIYYDEIVDDIVLSNIYKLIGKKYWNKFQRCFSDTHTFDGLDELNVEIITGGVAGLYTIQESILMIDKNKDFWGAFINDEDDKVYYFTSKEVYKDHLPKTIEQWRENFKEKEIVYLTEEIVIESTQEQEEKKDRLIADFVEFLSMKQKSGEEIYMSDKEVEDFFIRCISDSN